jgi:hypothetical protein
MFSTPFTFFKSVSAGPAPAPVEQTFTTNGTWSCCSGATCIEVIAVGGGGGGRSFTPWGEPNPGRSSGGPGGGAGEVKICTLTSAFGSSQCVIIGSGGAANSNGQSSCFGSLVISTGGLAGSTAVCSSGTGSSTANGGNGGAGSPAGGNARACSANLGSGGYKTENQGCAGGSATGKPGGGGAGGGSSSCAFVYLGCGGAGGAGGTICDITLGTGGTGGTNANDSCMPLIAGGNATGYGAGGGGAAASNGYIAPSPTPLGGCGSPGVVKVIQYFS